MPIDPHEAPPGYRAVPYGEACDGCQFPHTVGLCQGYVGVNGIRGVSGARKDGISVIYVRDARAAIHDALVRAGLT